MTCFINQEEELVKLINENVNRQDFLHPIIKWIYNILCAKKEGQRPSNPNGEGSDSFGLAILTKNQMM